MQAANALSQGFLSLQEIGIAVSQGVAHGFVQGVLSLMQGGTFEQAFVAGALGSLAASGWGAGMKSIGLDKFSKSAAGTIGFGALAGGVGSALSGGNFWEGAVIGGVVAGLNHVAHNIVGEPGPKRSEKILEKIKSLLDGLGIDIATKDLILSLAKAGEDTGQILKNFKNVLSVAGNVLGVASVSLSINEYLSAPTTANLIKALVTVSIVGGSMLASEGLLTKPINFLMSISDSAGWSDKIFNKIGNYLNNVSGKNLGLLTYNEVNLFFKK